MSLITCPDCDGAGYTTENTSRRWPRDPQWDVDVRCHACMGTGERESKPADDFPEPEERIRATVVRDEEPPL